MKKRRIKQTTNKDLRLISNRSDDQNRDTRNNQPTLPTSREATQLNETESNIKQINSVDQTITQGGTLVLINREKPQSERFLGNYPKPMASFISQLIACNSQFPDYRSRRRAAPDTASAHYKNLKSHIRIESTAGALKKLIRSV